jgi:hypothetical protein
VKDEMVKKEKKYDMIVREVNDVLNTYHQKMTLRQIYYRLVSKHVFPNNLNQYKALSRYLVKARENGEVDWRRIEDRARTTHGGDYGRDGIDDIESFLQDKIDEFKNLWEYIGLTSWKGQENYVEVWIEKDALSRLAENAVSDLNVKVCPSKGYSSFTYIAETVNRLRRIKDRNIHILYFGDFDPSGLDIERDLYERLVRYGAPSDLQVTRIALSREQIDEYNLPPFPAKVKDARHERFVYETGSTDSVELDALEPPILSAMIHDAVSDLIDWETWREREEEESDLKEKIREKLEEVEIEFEWDEY